MIKRSYIDYLKDIQNAIEGIETFSVDMDFGSFLEDRKTINAVVRSLEVIGEAAKNIPEHIKKSYPEMPWNEMAGTRDILIHAYFGIDEKVIWKTIKEDLVKIKPIVKRIIAELKKA